MDTDVLGRQDVESVAPDELGEVPSRTEGLEATIENALPTAQPSKVRAVLEGSKHFIGGLVPHPVESTKHYSILRHSHGIVMYRGLLTNVAVTIFSDVPLPSSRTIWLQQKGWTGQRGMRVKMIIRKNGTWIEVTPQAHVLASQISLSDERAWQRDITRFLRKASENKKTRQRKVVETCIIRIPCTAQDGYFRLVLCADEGKKVLCPSPVFRVVSLSTSSASIKGASLSALPVELGIKALTTFSMNTVGSAATPLISAIQNQFSQYMPGILTQQAATTAYEASSAQAKVDRMNQRYDKIRDSSYDEITGHDRLLVVGSTGGPDPPYPIKFSGTVVRGAGRSNVETGLPTANLRGVRDELKAGLNGIYFGWCSIQNSKVITREEWRPVLIFVMVSQQTPTVTPKKAIRAYVLKDFQGADFYDARLSVMLMGYLRSWKNASSPSFAEDIQVDIMVAQQSLNREQWDPITTSERIKSQTTLSDRYVNTRQFGQRQFDRLPLDKVALRTPKNELKEGIMGKGGLCIERR